MFVQMELTSWLMQTPWSRRQRSYKDTKTYHSAQLILKILALRYDMQIFC